MASASSGGGGAAGAKRERADGNGSAEAEGGEGGASPSEEAAIMSSDSELSPDDGAIMTGLSESSIVSSSELEISTHSSLGP